MPGKKIRSPRNKTDYELRKYNTKNGRRGQIKGTYPK